SCGMLRSVDALAGIDHQERAFAGGERAVDLVGEIDVAGRVDQVEDVVLAVARPIVEPDRLRLDGDAALALDIHRIEHLLDHLALLQAAGELDQPVGQRGLAMVDIGDDREIADVGYGGGRHGREITPLLRCGKERLPTPSNPWPSLPRPWASPAPFPRSSASSRPGQDRRRSRASRPRPGIRGPSWWRRRPRAALRPGRPAPRWWRTAGRAGCRTPPAR